ncbi:HofP DNA utilization family protein [Enterobacteriaceae bacterium ESL0689]|nr:HofP DNA utilization family protein [Enterobacteriaceae bacterium ESL0689]
MPGKGWCLLGLMAFFSLASERDPFQPPEDRCQTAQLTRWHYGGAVGHASRWIGILRDNNGKWLRVKENQSLSPGWRVQRLTTEKIEIITGPGCEPAHWIWQRRKGDAHALDKPAIAVAADTESRSTR